MSRHMMPIDISKMPDLVRIVEEMKHAKEPRVLKHGDSLVAMILPMKTALERHEIIDAFDFKPLTEVKASLLKAGYDGAEVADMIEALSELPRYADADTTIQKSH